MLPVVVNQETISELFRDTQANEGYSLTVDLAGQTITRPDGSVVAFEVDSFRKNCLLNGLDDIGLTLEEADTIKAFEDKWRQKSPWYFTSASI
jgi:3-isopropylmalate/(R)-2-methylmalate dehydratase small subunit